MAVQKLAFLVFTFLTISTVAAREVPAQRSLETRLRIGVMAESGDGGGLVDCWESLLELRSCNTELVDFLLNGEGDMAQYCCRAIRIITHQCWPSMLTAIGFTVEEGDLLRDYCDMAPASGIPAPAPAPAQ